MRNARHPGDARWPGILDAKTGGLCAYLLGWVSGLIVLFTHTDREVRFHAAQSVITFGWLTVFLVLWRAIMGQVLGDGLIGGLLLTLSVLLICGLSLALWGFLCFQAYTLSHFKLPVIGTLAERIATGQDPPARSDHPLRGTGRSAGRRPRHGRRRRSSW
ncbi:MAG: DUF4870 domain-containing protein [Egibacteraceae bacterium]